MLHDRKHAYRMLMNSKGWTLVVLLSLAIGIGAITALFTAVNGRLLQTISVRDAGELVILKWTGKNDMVRSSSARRAARVDPMVALRSEQLLVTQRHQGIHFAGASSRNPACK